VPLAASIGLDPMQLGLIMVINLAIRLYMPPIGTTLFIGLDRQMLARGHDA
jgi:TRAP-type C4-dicarboxylate transport system permease large subunit